MMKSSFLALILLQFNRCLFAQLNLVPNPGFEDTINCAANTYKPEAAMHWFNPTLSTPDYYSAYPICGYSSLNNPNGYQLPHTGLAYCGVITFRDSSITREYIEVKLNDSLLAGHSYTVEFYVSRSNNAKYSSDAFGAYFSLDSVTDYTSYGNLSYLPQVYNQPFNYIHDTLNWIQITGSFIAAGGEKYCTIGNFLLNSATNIVSDTGFFWNYNTAYVDIDDVSVKEDSTTGIVRDIRLYQFSVFPNPITHWFYVQSYKDLITKINVFDVAGRFVSESDFQPGKYLASVDCSGIKSGFYVLEIFTKNSCITRKFSKF